MKKIMIIAAAALMAGLCSASTVKWNVTNIYKTDDAGQGLTASSDKASAGTYYVMCFLSSELSLADAQSLIANDKLADLAGKATYQGTTTGNGLYASAYFDGGYQGGNSVSIYAVVLNSDAIDTATYAAISATPSTYEFADANNWHIIENFAEKMGGRDDIWYATNIELYYTWLDYQRLECSADGSIIHNPSVRSVWFADRKKNVYEVKPGETVVIK